MNTKLIIALVALFSISTINASAQKNPGLRDENRRIHQGVNNGELTRLEAARLNVQKEQLRNEAIRYKTNDGRIGKCERADLRRDNRGLSKNIYRQKHDRQRRG